ncbi:MAG: GxxExxY protein [Ignavibacteria bacterium]|nr:GxxExxY protein [Ignavibacteria bacterium]
MEMNDISYKVIGCAMKVHNELGTGFQEVIYQRALKIELTEAGLSFQREVEMPIYYKGEIIGERRVDFLVEEKMMVELKAISEILPVHQTQAVNYLEAYHLADGLLINFGAFKLEYHRVYNNRLTGKNQSWKTDK